MQSAGTLVAAVAEAELGNVQEEVRCTKAVVVVEPVSSSVVAGDEVLDTGLAEERTVAARQERCSLANAQCTGVVVVAAAAAAEEEVDGTVIGPAADIVEPFHLLLHGHCLHPMKSPKDWDLETSVILLIQLA